MAVSPVFGTTGDRIDVVLENGEVIPCIVADQKGVDATNKYGHVLAVGNGYGVDIIEWEIVTNKSNVDLSGWNGVKVDKIINYGEYTQ